MLGQRLRRGKSTVQLRLRLPTRALHAVAGYLILCAVAVAQDPPFFGTVWVDPDVIQPTDPTSYQFMAYAGIASRLVFDRRENAFSTKPMHIFDTVYADDLLVEVQVNSSDFSQASAAEYAESYAEMVGRLPRSLRLDVETMCIHGGGALPFGGGNNSILIHVDVEPSTTPFLEEILFHEAAHTSYGPEHDTAPGWTAAQQADPTFISSYARDFPSREDVAESLLMWYAVRFKSERIDDSTHAATEAAIPNRLGYFDALPFETGEPFPQADFNENYVVDEFDLASWQSGYGIAAGASHGQGDADGDKDVDGHDYMLWQREVGLDVNGPGDLRAVPEPAITWLLGGVTCSLIVAFRSSRSTGCNRSRRRPRRRGA
jgi:hypothetical protein